MLDRVRLISVRWWLRWLPIMVLLLAAYLRFHQLAAPSFWHDEGNTLRLIQRSLPDLIKAVKPDIHPPGYYLLLKAWAALLGEHEFGLRSYSAFWGLLSVSLTYALGARLYARAAGILAAALVALHPLAIYYSQEARMYTQLTGLAVLSLWLLLLMLQSAASRRRFRRLAAALALVNALGLYTQYTYPVVMLVQGVFFLWWWSGHGSRWALGFYTLANGLSILAFLPWLPSAYTQITRWTSFDTGVPLAAKLESITRALAFGSQQAPLTWLDWLPLVLLLLALLLPDWYPQPPSNAWRVLLPLVWLLGVSALLVFSGAFRETNLKFLLPAQLALALLLGRSLYYLWDVGSGSAALPLEMLPRYVAGFMGLLLFSTLLSITPRLYSDAEWQRDDYRSIAAYIRQQGRAEDAIILNAPNQQEVFSYYFPQQAHVYPLPRGLGGDDAATAREMDSILGRYGRIFLVLWSEGERDPNNVVKSALDDHSYEVFSRWYGDVRLLQYAVLAEPPEVPTVALDILFGEHIHLEGYALSGEAAPGSVLGVSLFWNTQSPLSERYKVSVQLLNAEGRLIAQHDSEPDSNRRPTSTWQPGESIADHHGLPVPAGSPPGAYSIIVSVYEYEPPHSRLAVQGGDFLNLEELSIQ